jgi:RNA polymerase sigma-70 factor (ECF subfamily)
MLYCLQIRLNDDLSLNEVAARLRLSLPATKTRLLRAKRRVIASAAARSTACRSFRRQERRVALVQSPETISVQSAIR